MSVPAPLDLAALAHTCDPATLPFATTAEAEPVREMLGQDRAVEAVRFGITMRSHGYNVFAIGPAGTGKETLIRDFLTRQAIDETPASDWCYVHNFDDPRRPRALRLPPGRGAALRADLARVVADLRVALPSAFESEEHRTRRQQLQRGFQERQETAFAAVQEHARAEDVAVVRTETGVLLAPLRGGESLSPEDLRSLSPRERERLESAMERAREQLRDFFAQLHDAEREQREATQKIDREAATAVAARVVGGVRAGWQGEPSVVAYLAAFESDVVDHAEDFLAGTETGVEGALQRALRRGPTDGPTFRRYQVNVLVDRTGVAGSPVVFEDHPTHGNLLGRIEQVSELGTLTTDFTLVQAGALHRANGGYLVVDALRLLQQPFAWDALKRVLRRGEIRLESAGQLLGLAATASLEPEPIPIESVKVILVGERFLYYLLAAHDIDFHELFKVVADFDEATLRDQAVDALYARLVATLVRNAKLRPFDRTAVARVLDQAARLTGDAGKLSVRMRPVVDLLREADFCAGRAGRATVERRDVDDAVAAQRHRAGRVHERLLDEILRGTLRVETAGEALGQVNGLAVFTLGEHEFGHPTRITARVRMGKGEVVDIEREVELGGALHSKGVLILAGFLGARYTARAPLALSASLVFEQSYGPVEGDSASLAELCALLAALAELPVRQSLAMTGSVDQLGRVQAIGGVNEKIEGFFDVCRRRGLTGEQGVIIPATNVQHLMLREEVLEAARAGQFRVWAVATVDEALELLTGVPAGVRGEDGSFPEGSVNARIEARLETFAADARARAAEAGDAAGS
jgi:lon-related putative ATP-dependent protease